MSRYIEMGHQIYILFHNNSKCYIEYTVYYCASSDILLGYDMTNKETSTVVI